MSFRKVLQLRCTCDVDLTQKHKSPRSLFEKWRLGKESDTLLCYGATKLQRGMSPSH